MKNREDFQWRLGVAVREAERISSFILRVFERYPAEFSAWTRTEDANELRLQLESVVALLDPDQPPPESEAPFKKDDQVGFIYCSFPPSLTPRKYDGVHVIDQVWWDKGFGEWRVRLLGIFDYTDKGWLASLFQKVEQAQPSPPPVTL